MPFNLKTETLKLDFGSDELNEMNVVVTADVPLSTFFDLQIWLSSDDAKQMRDAFMLFGNQILRSWDVEDDGVSIPADEHGFLSLPLTLGMSIVTTWTETVGGAKKALGVSQNGISQSVGELIETATK